MLLYFLLFIENSILQENDAIDSAIRFYATALENIKKYFDEAENFRKLKKDLLDSRKKGIDDSRILIRKQIDKNIELMQQIVNGQINQDFTTRRIWLKK